MGRAAGEISSDEVEGLRCFRCACDISAFVSREFAADVDCPTKILGRSESLEGSRGLSHQQTSELWNIADVSVCRCYTLLLLLLRRHCCYGVVALCNVWFTQRYMIT